VRRITAEVALEPSHDGYFRRAIVETPRVRAYWLSFAPGTTVPEHAHGTADEIFYVVGGAARIELRDEVHAVEPGDTLVLEPGEFHRIVVGDEPFVLLAVVAPNADDTLPGQDRA
jgi:quercetin dioxygenase-like cupin family protein